MTWRRADRDNPRIVLLTPGPYNETYFEHAYLARYLGFTLVEGGDLTVRDNRVFLKMLDGLQPVDVILRRLDDDFCDPLELRGDSFLGVPGLVQAVRAGNVAVANALGSGLRRVAGAARLPAAPVPPAARRRAAPAVGARPGGAASRRRCAHVLATWASWSSSRPSAGRGASRLRRRSSRRERGALAAEHPRPAPGLRGQERCRCRRRPVWPSERLEPRHVVVRVYVAADGDSFAVMPGGLTRVAAGADTAVVSMQRGGGSKDTWVLAAGPVAPFQPAAPGARRSSSAAPGDLPSRVADNLFWLGRYAERTEAWCASSER